MEETNEVGTIQSQTFLMSDVSVADMIEQNQSWMGEKTGNIHSLNGSIFIHYAITYTEDDSLGSKVTYLKKVKKLKIVDHRDLMFFWQETDNECETNKVHSECAVIRKRDASHSCNWR